jgi:NADH-ubiquinone oxidoreductase chain 5
MLDFMSLYFISLVRLVAGRVIVFSTSYISGEWFFGRFVALVISFVISIFMLILSPNMVRIILGWDGLGVTSYLLVIFYQRSKSYNAGIITALTNRLGDVGLLISIAIFFSYGTWRFTVYGEGSHKLPATLITIIIMAACTKSAQMPFSAWLPAAMAAPTPVSALVHSSTLVTAGVYLLIRINIFLVNFAILEVLIFLGTFTILMAGGAAILEIDIKKIIALSTLRQLGVIIITLGAGNPILAYLHLLSHAFFKAILFMCAGVIIHNIKDYQDIRKIGLGWYSLPVIMSTISVANIRLCGLPFLRGFYSKDMVLEIIIIRGPRLIILSVIILATFLTVMYSCRLSFLVGLRIVKSEIFYQIVEGDKMILAGIFILLPFSIAGGIYLTWSLIASASVVFLPFWLKLSISLTILFAIFVISKIFESFSRGQPTPLKLFTRTIWYMPLTFSISLSDHLTNYSKGFFKRVEITWAESILFKQALSLFYLRGPRIYLDRVSHLYIIQVVKILLFTAGGIFLLYLSNLNKILICGVRNIPSILNIGIIFNYDL